MLYKIERVIYDILMLVKSEGYIVMITAVLVKNDYSKHCVRAELFGHVLTVKMGECCHFWGFTFPSIKAVLQEKLKVT